jgi:hypothetical protein
MLVPITQEVWFIKGHCRYLGAVEIIPWLEEPRQDLESLDSNNNTLVTSSKAELPSKTKYINDIIWLLRQKKKRIQKHKRKLTLTRGYKNKRQTKLRTPLLYLSKAHAVRYLTLLTRKKPNSIIRARGL